MSFLYLVTLCSIKTRKQGDEKLRKSLKSLKVTIKSRNMSHLGGISHDFH